MNSRIEFAALVVFFLFLAACGEAKPNSAGQEVSFQWLSGCWESQDGAEVEVWMPSQDSALQGFAVTVRDGRVGFFEVLAITRTDGVYRYVAAPNGKNTTEFDLTEYDATSATFTNAKHDYPQVIAYRRDSDQLLATISELGGKNPRHFDKRICR